jgi:hypothetical protein
MIPSQYVPRTIEENHGGVNHETLSGVVVFSILHLVRAIVFAV